MEFKEDLEKKKEKPEIHLHQSNVGSLFSYILNRLESLDEKQKMLMEGQINMIEEQLMTISAIKDHDLKVNNNISNVNSNVLGGFDKLEKLSNLKTKVDKEFTSELGTKVIEFLKDKKESTTSELLETFKQYASRATMFRTLSELDKNNLILREHGKILAKN